ncbi:MAG TPA: efflux RND transporter periplasmic adaptor subunit [Bacteroidota bacterium]|nr:efflux RND transporter periplasmic adaptor subunit [Bacteroidota bacterium]
MNRHSISTKKGVLIAALALAAFSSFNCQEKSDAGGVFPESLKTAVVDHDGTTIRFPSGSTGLEQIRTTVARQGTVLVSVIGPARVVATITPGTGTAGNLFLFESSDITTLYSQYRQSRSNADLASKNLVRVKEMFDNQGATSRDLNQAEADAANARASMNEMEGRLRALGFSPAELESVKTQMAWLISDVPESELHEVQKGEDVDVYFTSFPGQKMIGKAVAIGDIVDPVTRTVKVRVTLHNPGGRLLPGMFARVDYGDPKSGVIVLPYAAIVTVDAQDYAFIETAAGEFTRRRVTVSNANAQNALVLGGISDGEKVVTRGAMLLKGLSFGY